MREYSIPHLRRAGKISIPEDSFDRIRRVRDLHKEGFGTGSVRHALREVSLTAAGPDTRELEKRLDRLSRNLEEIKGDLQGAQPAVTDALPSHSLRTIMARQNVLMSAVINLTEMVEELMLATGRSRRTVGGSAYDLHAVAGELAHQRHDGARRLPGTVTAIETPSSSVVPARTLPMLRDGDEPQPGVGNGFGALARRRKRGLLAFGGALAIAAALSGAAGAAAGFGWPGAVTGGPSEEPRAAATQTPREGEDEEAANPAEARADARRAAVPDVSGEGIEEATRKLEDAGFEVAVKSAGGENGEPAEMVIGTEPGAGKQVEAGGRVALVVGGGPEKPGGGGGGAADEQYGE